MKGAEGAEGVENAGVAADAEVAPIADTALHALLVQARRTGDAPLRRLVTDYLTLRRVTADVVALIAAREGGAGVARTPLFRRLQQLAAARPR